MGWPPLSLRKKTRVFSSTSVGPQGVADTADGVIDGRQHGGVGAALAGEMREARQILVGGLQGDVGRIEGEIDEEGAVLVLADVVDGGVAEGVGDVGRVLDSALVAPEVGLIGILGDEGNALRLGYRQEGTAAAEEAVMICEAADERAELGELAEVPLADGEGGVAARLEDVGHGRPHRLRVRFWCSTSCR